MKCFVVQIPSNPPKITIFYSPHLNTSASNIYNIYMEVSLWTVSWACSQDVKCCSLLAAELFFPTQGKLLLQFRLLPYRLFRDIPREIAKTGNELKNNYSCEKWKFCFFPLQPWGRPTSHVVKIGPLCVHV